MWSLDFDQRFNCIEALWWIGLGVTVLILALKRTAKKVILFFGATILILFGISDFIEIQTGVWWKPLWLLMWKAGCIIIGISCMIFYFKKGRQL
jgi:hypothetical protein